MYVLLQESPEVLVRVELDAPIRLGPGERCGIYVHSELPGDEGLVYDNQKSSITYTDRFVKLLPGMAHLSNRPFGRHGMWGGAWRGNREFSGKITYGVKYMLWSPFSSSHVKFPRQFNEMARTLVCANRFRTKSLLSRLPADVIYYILNMYINGLKAVIYVCALFNACSPAVVMKPQLNLHVRFLICGVFMFF